TSYYHADAATPINVHYAVECTTCHNPHLASGRWDDATSGTGSPTPIVLPGVTQSLYLSNPATYPYQWPPSSWGMSYQPGDLWGDDPEEKMNGLLQHFPNIGTGGWQFNKDRGYGLGATNMPFDQYAIYRPPYGGTTGGYEPDGNALPDYVTFCLDCHQHQVGTHLPIYWGKDSAGNAFPPGVNKNYCASGSQPDGDCVTASGWEPHGLDAANVSPFGCCAPGSPYVNNCNTPDTDAASPFYNEPIGRGFAVYTKAPYEMADRIAGINFVLACVNCHEPHGSPLSSLFRKRVNGNDITSASHNYICNACHYYYGGLMTNESSCGGSLKGCGTSSCHLKQSLHRIDNNNLGDTIVLYALISKINLGPKVPATNPGIVGTSKDDRATNPEVMQLSDGRYRMYYAYKSDTSANFWDIGYKDTSDTNPPNDTNIASSPLQLLGIGVSGDQAYGPEIVQLGDGRYRLYYNRASGGNNTIVYRDTTDTNPPNAGNLGAATQLIGTSTMHPNVVARPGGGYRVYYANLVSSNEKLSYRDTTNGNPPDNTNLGSAIDLGMGGTQYDRASWPKVLQTATGYRLYYGYGDNVPNCACWRILYKDTTDANLPGPTNLSLMKTLNTGGSSTDSAMDPEIILLPDGKYRMYYTWFETTGNYSGNYHRIVYKDTTDTNLPNVGY
ncbi:MAG: hypothetical protein HY886_06090, partial [Deltaproteobacteria bacterium]|nr:hypothetical protein [Deltaproteobacteria bacterium]